VNNSSSWTGYGNYVSQMVHVHRGDQINVTVTITDVYSTDVLYAWVDWNLDGDFDDPGENVYANNSSQSTYSFTINVPSDAAIGNTRLRIRLNDAGQDANTEPCGNTSYGEVEDYTIAVEDGITVLKEPVAETVKIYPNPAENILYIKAGNEYKYQILTISGKIIKEGVSTNELSKIKVKGLKSGIYIIKIIENQKSIIKKLIIK